MYSGAKDCSNSEGLNPEDKVIIVSGGCAPACPLTLTKSGNFLKYWSDPDAVGHSVEVLTSDGSPWCSLPDLSGPLDPSLGWTLTQDSDSSTACLDN